MNSRNLNRRDRRNSKKVAKISLKPNRHFALGVVLLTSISVASVSIANNTAPTNPNGTNTTVNTTASQPGTGSVNVLNTQGGITSVNSEAGEANTNQVSNSSGIVDNQTLQNAQDCATSPTGIVAASNETTQNRISIYSTSVNIDNIFKPTSSGGCFADIGKIADLSVYIPDWTGIATAAANMLKQYALKKVCNAVYEASSELLGPVNEAIDKINKYGSALDVNGGFNEWANKELSKIDPELVLPSTPPKEEYSFDVGDIIKGQIDADNKGNGNGLTNKSPTQAGNSVSEAIGMNSSTANAAKTTPKTNAASNAAAVFGN